MLHRAEVLSGGADLFELHRRQPDAYPFLLQSVAAGTGAISTARYDILFAGLEDALLAMPGDDWFEQLSRRVAREPPLQGEGVPFCGGWFLFLSYEAASLCEPRLHLPPVAQGLPMAVAVRCTAAIVRDRAQDRFILIAERSEEQLQNLRRDLQACATASKESSPARLIGEVLEDPEEKFVSGVERVLEYLRAGDVFQVNLSRGWQARLGAGRSYVDIYQALRLHNPAPFAGLARFGDSVVISSSPERLIELQGGFAQTRPIAGTRRRGAAPAEDRELQHKLLQSVKERAEHVMLIDLERNDLGRVCAPGSIEVSELMALESYAHVHHIVSNVRGRLREGVGPGQALRAVFPGGTITGCPKVRAMEIIAELEGVGRGAYTGSMGYLSRCGRMDLNILIRSLVVQGDRVSFRAGAGIVADSQPHAELAETRAKARGLLLALGVAA